MTPKQLQKFLDDAGLSQRRAAFELGIDERTMRRYVSGESAIPRPVQLALRALERRPVALDDLTDRERIDIDEAKRDFRLARPGERPLEVQPYRNGEGSLVAIEFRWGDGRRLKAGQAIKNRRGEWQVEVL